MIWSKTHNWVIKKRGTHTIFFWLDFLILFSSLKFKNFEWKWWKPKTPIWCFQFLRYITQWQDCKFLTSMWLICVDGVSSLLLYPLSFFSHFFLFLSFSDFSLSVFYFFLPLSGSFFPPFSSSAQFRHHHQSKSLKTPLNQTGPNKLSLSLSTHISYSFTVYFLIFITALS